MDEKFEELVLRKRVIGFQGKVFTTTNHIARTFGIPCWLFAAEAGRLLAKNRYLRCHVGFIKDEVYIDDNIVGTNPDYLVTLGGFEILMDRFSSTKNFNKEKDQYMDELKFVQNLMDKRKIEISKKRRRRFI